MLLLRIESLLFTSCFLMLFKACVLLDHFADKLCTSVPSRREADLEMQTNIHLDIRVGEFTHPLSQESLQTHPRWLHTPAQKTRISTQEPTLRLAQSKKSFWLWLLLIWDSTCCYPDLWFINPVAGQGGGWAEDDLNEICWVLTRVCKSEAKWSAFSQDQSPRTESHYREKPHTGRTTLQI